MLDVEASTALTRPPETPGDRQGRPRPAGRLAGRAEPAAQQGARDRPARRQARGALCASSASACPRSRPARRRRSASSPRSGAARRSACGGSTRVSELEPERVRPLLRGAFGEPYLYAIETTSTQDLIRDDDLPHGAVAVAEHQTAGRGRSGRRWDDAPSSALLCSVALRPPGEAPLPQLSLVAGLAVAVAVEAELGAPTEVKWPNDVLIAGRKVAGTAARGVRWPRRLRDRRQRQPGEARPAAADPHAGDVAPARDGPERRPGVLLVGVLTELERHYDRWLAGGLAALLDDLERRNALRGRRVRADGRVGTAGAIAPDGRLTIVLDRGDTVLVESGEVELGGGGSPDDRLKPVAGSSRTPGLRPRRAPPIPPACSHSRRSAVGGRRHRARDRRSAPTRSPGAPRSCAGSP